MKRKEMLSGSKRTYEDWRKNSHCLWQSKAPPSLTKAKVGFFSIIVLDQRTCIVFPLTLNQMLCFGVVRVFSPSPSRIDPDIGM